MYLNNLNSITIHFQSDIPFLLLYNSPLEKMYQLEQFSMSAT